MTKKNILLVAGTADDYKTFAEANDLGPSNYHVGKTANIFKGKHHISVIFIEGWRARPDAMAMIQAANEAEVRGIKIIEAKVDQILYL